MGLHYVCLQDINVHASHCYTSVSILGVEILHISFILYLQKDTYIVFKKQVQFEIVNN